MSDAISRQAAFLAALGDLQHQPPFADFTVQLKDGPVRTSRILLAAMSPVFKKMALERPAENFQRLEMTQLSRTAWECIAQFYLGRDASLSLESVAEILEVCNWYQMDELREHCGDFLTSCCTSENCPRVWDIAKEFGLEISANNDMQVVMSRLQTGFTPEAFQCLKKTTLLELLEKGELQATEDDVCLAVLAWMEAHKEDTDSCTEVFQRVKLQKVTDDFLAKHVLFNRVSGGIPALRSKVQQEVLRRCQHPTGTPAEQAALPRSLPQSTDDRPNAAAKKILEVPTRSQQQSIHRGLLVVGADMFFSQYLYRWSFRMNKWIELHSSSSIEEAFSAAAIAGDKVFITAGEGSSKTICFDLRSKTSTTKDSLKEERKSHSMAVVGGKVYAVGGYDDEGILSSIEEYSETTSQWTHVGDLQVHTYDCAVAALGDVLLIVGGGTEDSESLIQTYHVETRTAAVLDDPLPRPMRYCRGTTFGNTAYFVGGKGYLVQIREVEGTFQVVSHAVLKSFPKIEHSYGVHVEAGRVRVLGGKYAKAVLCWSLDGRKLKNDDMDDLPDEMLVFAAGEVDVPP